MATLAAAPWFRARLIPGLKNRQSLLHCRNGDRRYRQSLCFRRRSFSVYASAGDEGAVRVRFAPSPTGNLHVGGARTALFNYLFARSKGGKFILRIEDTDLERSTRESEEAVLRDLSWLGLAWDEGPGIGGNYGPYRQSERNALYKQFAEKLLQSGHVYRCFCSNEELEKMKEMAKLKQLPPIYTGRWASATEEEVQEELAKGTPYTYRFRVPKEGSLKIDDLIRGEVSWNFDTLGDFVIMRSNGQPVYNFCVTVDDATMAISHVIRAEEHLPNTLRQALIYKALDFPMPHFAHVSLILAPDRSKLSKRHGATSVGQFRDMGYLPQAMVNYLSLLGWGDGTENEFFTLEQLVEKFTIERVNRSGAIFDSTKLRWMNGQHLRSLPSEELNQIIGERWTNAGIVTESQGVFIKDAVLLLKDGIDLIPDSEKALSSLLSYPLYETLASAEGKPILEDGVSEVAKSLLAAYDSGELSGALAEGQPGWKSWVKNFGKMLKRKGKSLFMPLRVLLTGKLHGPDIGATTVLLYKAGTSGSIVPQAGFANMAFSSTVSPKHCRLSSAASSSSSYFPKFQIPLKLNKITPCHSSSKLRPSIACVLTEKQSMAAQSVDEPAAVQRPDSFGRFGKFGGKYVPETLMHALDELEIAFESLATDEGFQKELDGILRDYVGRESPLYFAERLTVHYKRPNGEGPLIYLKREDLNHTGAHKINNAVAQALLAKRLGKKRIIAETGAGQHGVATATVCARFGLECIIYMGAQDMERQALNVFRMRLLGAEVRAVHSGTATLKDATSEAIRDWVTNVETTHYILGSVAGPHPYPMMVREFHAVIGKETRKQALEKWGGKPDVLVACIGGGSNAMGLFHEFVDDKDVRLIGVEAAGFGIDSGKHAATLTKGEVGVLHGAMSYLLQDEDGQIVEPHSISAGLDYPGVGPEHSFLKDLGRAEYYSITDEEALEAFKRLSRLEGIIPALETSHALAYLEKLCPTLPNGTRLVLNCSGRGDKDVQTAIKYLKV